MKTYTVKITDKTNSTQTTVQGTIPELIKQFEFTLYLGRKYQFTQGGKKINSNPKTITSLINNLNNSVANSIVLGYPELMFQL